MVAVLIATGIAAMCPKEVIPALVPLNCASLLKLKIRKAMVFESHARSQD